jgi:hypothetical protein
MQSALACVKHVPVVERSLADLSGAVPICLARLVFALALRTALLVGLNVRPRRRQGVDTDSCQNLRTQLEDTILHGQC